MYGENGRLCVNWSTRYNTSGQPTGIPQTKLINVIKPVQTVFMAEVDPNSTVNLPTPVAGSNVTALYSIARHMKNTLGNFAMCDGSAISDHTNDFWEPQPEADGTPSGSTGAYEWQVNTHFVYWYPSPTTPN